MNATSSSDDRQKGIAARTSREQETMVLAVHALEGAMASPAPGREQAWKQRARHELASVVGLLQEHCEAAEADDGIIGEVEVRLGRSYEVSRARRDHERLAHEAVSLLAALDEYSGDSALSFQEVRRQVAQLTAALRDHQGREADLLLLALDLDVGVPD
ncbi:MAG: hypothetical protein WEE64_04890 [Dehalococcoidia bacterium]